MHLLNAETRKLEQFPGGHIPPYAILSHTWGEKEVSMHDLINDTNVESKERYIKIKHSCEQARVDGLEYVWIDTCCIDKTSSAELSEAINSMFNWYANAEKCYAYLADVWGIRDPSTPETTLREPLYRPIADTKPDSRYESDATACTAVRITEVALHEDNCNPSVPACICGITSANDYKKMFSQSRWFTRGWTLQELIAPTQVFFFDFHWNYIGNRNGSLLNAIANITGIDIRALQASKPSQSHSQSISHVITTFSVAQRMSWAAQRYTTKVEDQAYCLLGLLGVNMPLLYGEREKAFYRLQREILDSTTDHSILAWEGGGIGVIAGHPFGNILAPSIRNFEGCGDIRRVHSEVLGPNARTTGAMTLTPAGLQLSTRLAQFADCGKQYYDVVLNCERKGSLIALRAERRKVDDASTITHLELTPFLGTRLYSVHIAKARKAKTRDIFITPVTSPTTGYSDDPRIWVRLKNKSHVTGTGLSKASPEHLWDILPWPNIGGEMSQPQLLPAHKLDSAAAEITFFWRSLAWKVKFPSPLYQQNDNQRLYRVTVSRAKVISAESGFPSVEEQAGLEGELDSSAVSLTLPWSPWTFSNAIRIETGEQTQSKTLKFDAIHVLKISLALEEELSNGMDIVVEVSPDYVPIIKPAMVVLSLLRRTILRGMSWVRQVLSEVRRPIREDEQLPFWLYLAGSLIPVVTFLHVANYIFFSTRDE
jgi:hypothetical protein